MLDDETEQPMNFLENRVVVENGEQVNEAAHNIWAERHTL